jgi:Flp pilus assembly protein TadG
MIRSREERGFTLLAMGVCAVVLFGMAGMAIDVGRMYITKNEAQTYADSASLYATQQLNGTSAGLTAADAAVAANPQLWGFATTAFTGTTTEYSVDGLTGWANSGGVSQVNVPNIRYVRVTANVTNLPLYLIPVIGLARTATVRAQAVAGQVLEGTSSTNPITNGVYPYSPIANVDATNSSQLSSTGDPFAFIVGQQYDLKWPHNASVGNVGDNKVPCAGDNTAAQINRSQGGADWGEIVFSSASALSSAIEDGIGGVNIAINQSVNPTSGEKNSEVSAIQNRISQDSDTTDDTLDSYLANPAHNGRRLITVIVNSGLANSAGVAYPGNQQAIGLGYAEFLLLISDDYTKNGGSNNPWCAIYVGPAPALGTPVGGGVGGGNGSGVAVIRLTQ